MASTDLSWTPPAWSSYNLTRDCNLFGEFFSGISRDGLLNAPLGATVDYFRSAMPANFAQPKVVQIVELWQAIVANYTKGINADEMFNSVYHAAEGTCHKEFCAAIGFQGNADLVGNGVMIAYFIEAALVSLFLFAMGLYRLTYHRSLKKSVANQEAPPHSALARVLDAFRGSITGFWSATAILSLTMLIISLRLTARARIYAERAVLAWRQGSAVSAYDTELATVVSVFSLFPVLILGLLVKNRGRRRWLMGAVHCILYVLVLAQIRLGIKHTSVASTISSLGRACNPSSVDRLFRKYGSPVFYVLIAVPIGLAVISATAAVLFHLRRDKRAHQQTETKIWHCALHFSRPYEASLKAFTCVACFTLMWASLGLLLYMRGEILKNVGHEDPALEWSFGQLLALATWFPVFVEWVYILIFGLERGLEGHVPQGYAVLFIGHTEVAQPSQIRPNLRPDKLDSCLDKRELSNMSMTT